MRLGWRSGGPFRWAFSGRYGDGRRRRCAGLRVGADLGRYRLIEPLGRGGMAEVWKARTSGPSGFQHDVVIKRIQPAHGADPEFIQLFLEEARISAMLHHPNIVQVHDFVERAVISTWSWSTSTVRRCRARCGRCARLAVPCRRRSPH